MFCRFVDIPSNSQFALAEIGNFGEPFHFTLPRRKFLVCPNHALTKLGKP